jgi:hypothetical protein
VIVLPAMRTFVSAAFASASTAPPLGPFASLDSACTLTLLPSILLFWMVSGASPQAHTAASAPKACPSGVFTWTEFPSSSEPLIVAVEPSARKTPQVNAFSLSVAPVCWG